MIFAHVVVGLLPVHNNHISWFWLVGSQIADLDHLAVLFYHRIFSWNKAVGYMRHEDKYNLRFKTKYAHSLFGAFVASGTVALFSPTGALYFGLAYLLHLLLDWPDQDEKQYLFPLPIKLRGFLPIFSLPEKIFTVALILTVTLLYVY